MSAKRLSTAVSLQVDRFTPVRHVAKLALAYADSGVVDYQTCTDQLVSWWPDVLWKQQMRNRPLGQVVRDADSFHDVYSLSAYMVAVTGGRLGAAPTLDCVRRGPAELIQTMATLSGMTNNRPIFMFGGGEQKQCKPFGYKRTEGFTRLEDLFRINKLMWECDKPFSFEGHHWKMQDAWLGTASRENHPEVWAVGGGPKLMEIAANYADGFATMARFVFVSPEHAAERISAMKKELAAHGRDPSTFRFGIIAAVLLHEDAAVLDRAIDDPLFRFMTATMGRINQNDWDLDSIEPPMPRDWIYAIKMLPSAMRMPEIDEWLGRTTRRMAEQTWIYGAPRQVGETLCKYVAAGADWIGVYDMLQFTLPLEEQLAAAQRSIEVCRVLKQRYPD